MWKRALIVGPAVLTGMLLAGNAGAQAPAAKPCAAAEHHQLDFWIGDWDAVDTKTGKVLGTNSITSLLGGCVIQERWTSENGSGMSLSLYRAYDKKWHYNWVDDQGDLLYLTGGFADGKMVMSGQAPDRKGKVTWRRLSWEKMPPDRVHQTYETSDDGKTWTMAFDGIYVPKKQASSR